jgi:hypothetical protein
MVLDFIPEVNAENEKVREEILASPEADFRKPVDDYSDLLDEALYDAALVKPAPEPSPEVLEKIDEGLKQIEEGKVVKAIRKPRTVKPKITADADKLAEASKETKAALEKPARKPRAKKSADAPRFTEEQKAARAEYARKYRQSMTDEQKEQAKARAAERQKRWRENHPEAVSKYAKRSSERRKERYNDDPEYRAEYRAKQRAYASAGKSEES